MFHSHELHLRAERILRESGPHLGEGLTYWGGKPHCAVGYLASEAGFLSLRTEDSTSLDAGSEHVHTVYGLEQGEISELIAINDAAGDRRDRNLLASLRRFCPVCRHMEVGSRERLLFHLELD